MYAKTGSELWGARFLRGDKLFYLWHDGRIQSGRIGAACYKFFSIAKSFFSVFQGLDKESTKFANPQLISGIVRKIRKFVGILFKIKVLFLSCYGVPDIFVMFCDNPMIGKFARRR